MEITEALEHIRTLLSDYRSTLYNLTDDGWKQINEKTGEYEAALLCIEDALEKPAENDTTAALNRIGTHLVKDCGIPAPEFPIGAENAILQMTSQLRDQRDEAQQLSEKYLGALECANNAARRRGAERDKALAALLQVVD